MIDMKKAGTHTRDLKLRPVAWIGLEAQIKAVITKHFVNELPFGGLTPSCLSCDHFNEREETCSKANDQRPPARVIAFGCEKYQDNDDIPF